LLFSEGSFEPKEDLSVDGSMGVARSILELLPQADRESKWKADPTVLAIVLHILIIPE